MKNIAAPKRVRIDAGKLLGSINQGYAGQISMIEGKLSKYGETIDRKLKMVSYNGQNVVFEDVQSNKFYRFDVKEENKQLAFTNLSELVVIDEDKEQRFSKICSNIVNSIENNDNDACNKYFAQMEKGFCTPKVIPESGCVRTRDGRLHTIFIENKLIPDHIKPLIVDTIKEAIKSSKVVINEGHMVFNDTKVRMPISEFVNKQVIARRMRNVAERAYLSDGFKDLVEGAAARISNKEIREAVRVSKDFFAEQQEFLLLDKDNFKTLIENTLFARGIFNHKLHEDTAELLWETNCLVNKNVIIQEWKTAAKSSNIKNFIDNAKILEDTANNPRKFSHAYDLFVKSVLNEDQSTKAIKAQAYLNMLKLLKNAISGSDADQAVLNQVDDLVVKLEGDINGIDDATLYEVEDLLATTGTDLTKDVSTLADFDTIPQPQAAAEFGGGEFDGDIGEVGEIGGEGGGMGGLGGGPDLGGEGGAGGAGGPDVPGEEDGMGGGGGGGMGGSPEAGLGAGAEGAAPGAEGAAEAPPAEAPGEEAPTTPGKEEEEDLFDSIVRKAKPINEMVRKDIDSVVKSMGVFKLEVIDGKNFRKQNITESNIKFVKSVAQKAKTISEELYNKVMASLYDATTDKVLVEQEKNNDMYTVNIPKIQINEEYDGECEEDDKECKEEKKKEKKEEECKDGVHCEGKNPVPPKNTEPSKEKKPWKKPWEKKNTDEPEKKNTDAPDKKNDKIDEAIIVATGEDQEKLIDAISQAITDTKSVEVDDGLDSGELIIDTDGGPSSTPGVPAPISPVGGGATVESTNVDKPVVKEDNNITDPSKKVYTSEEEAKKDGAGIKRNADPKLSDDGYAGGKEFNTGKDKPNTGLVSATKE